MLVGLWSVPGWCDETAVKANQSFTYQSQPIHPGLIKTFQNWISDYRPPITVTAVREYLKKSYDLAARGNIKGLQKEVEQLQKQDEQLIEFVTEVGQLAKTFQMEKIQSLIEQLAE